VNGPCSFSRIPPVASIPKLTEFTELARSAGADIRRHPDGARSMRAQSRGSISVPARSSNCANSRKRTAPT
jgi:hypothetical protein